MAFISIDLLRSLVAIAELRSFTLAARTLGVSQSTISQHIKRLEELSGRRCIERNTHRVGLTTAGEAMLGYARAIIESQERLQQHLLATPLRGRLRLGASEDFVLSALPDVLAAFVRRHPDVDLELRAGLSTDLYDLFDAGQLDLIFVKRRKGDPRGQIAWREPIRWTARPSYKLDLDTPAPLLLYPPPSVTRAHTLETLEAGGYRWRIAFTSASLTGLSAAARAGIGVFPHSARLLPTGLAILSNPVGLPPLPEVEFVIIGSGSSDPAAAALTSTILQWSTGQPILQ